MTKNGMGKRSKRDLRILAEDALIRRNVHGVMMVRDWELFHVIAACVEKNVDPAMARTDPSRYELLRDGVTHFHIGGLIHMTAKRVRDVTGYVPEDDLAAEP